MASTTGSNLRRPTPSDRVPQAALPLGGLGAGSVCVNAIGGLQDFSLYHRPAKSALPDGHNFTSAAFATLHVKGAKPVTRLVEGPLPAEWIYNRGLKAQGFREGGHEGLPRFDSATFAAEFPFATIALRDPVMPLRVELTAWSPFIPGDDVNSGLPCAILEYRLTNPTRKPVGFSFAYHLSHPVPGTGPDSESSRTRAVPGLGVSFSNTDAPEAPSFGSVFLATVGHRPQIKGMWLRGGWFDAISALWREVSAGAFVANDGSNGIDTRGRNGGSIQVASRLRPGASVTIPVLIAWHLPNSGERHGEATPPAACAPGSGCCDKKPALPPVWHPFYSSQFQDAEAVARHVAESLGVLRERTAAFRDALFGSTLPAPVIDAVASNLAILKSPTVMRQANGNVWGWEGCFCSSGCCHGSCTHVWNYAQAMPHLFPALERTLREQELERSMDERGHVGFRAALPDGPVKHDWHAAADGQLGGIMKVWREWQIGGDRAWLERLYPLARRSLDFCIGQWDPRQRGALSEPHHNTYDIEFWGPDGMCGSIYVGALSAAADMACALGENADQRRYSVLAAKAARFMERKLFNGDYFFQRVTYRGLKDTSFLKQIAGTGAGEVMRVLRREGPKYQYGTGCLADGVIGAWMAAIYGVETPLDRAKVRKNLAAIFRHNFRADLSEHANCQRPGYAIGHEPGLVLCTWPRGGKPTLPFPYSDEVWTGLEYHVASHCIAEGLVDEGLAIVAAARSRYDGRVRNPFDEYECGSYYARAMSSYALLGALSGFRYSAVDQTLRFGPKLAQRPFRTFFSTASGWGTVTLTKTAISVEVSEGELAIDRLILEKNGKTRKIPWSAVARPGQPCTLPLR